MENLLKALICAYVWRSATGGRRKPEVKDMKGIRLILLYILKKSEVLGHGPCMIRFTSGWFNSNIVSPGVYIHWGPADDPPWKGRFDSINFFNAGEYLEILHEVVSRREDLRTVKIEERLTNLYRRRWTHNQVTTYTKLRGG